MPSPPGVGSNMTLKPLKIAFPLAETGYCFVRSCPHGGVSRRSLFSSGDQKRASSARVKNPENIFCSLFEEDVFLY